MTSYREKGAGPALVLLHGVGGNADAWLPQLDFFAARYRTLAWNLPGYGGTPLPAEFRFPVLADALAAWLDKLRVERVHLLGHSLGGMLAQEFILRHPGRLYSLILSATSPAFGRPDGDWQRRFIDARLAPLDRGKTLAELAPGVVAELVGRAPDPAGVELAVNCMSAVPEATYRAAMRCLIGFDRRAELAAIGVPTLVLAGELDANAPAAMMAKMAGKIAGAGYRCLAGAGHLANLEQPAAFNRAVDDFLCHPLPKTDRAGQS